MHKLDYAKMKTLLAYAKDMKVWQKHWGNLVFTVDIPTERRFQAEKTQYMQMVQIHESVQLSIVAALLEGLLNINTSFMLRLLPDAEGKAGSPTITSVWGIFNLMELHNKKV